MPRHPVLLSFAFALGFACLPAPTPQRGAAGVQEGPEEGYLGARPPLARSPAGREGAPVPDRGPARGVHAAPEPQAGPVPVWPTMEFEPQAPLVATAAPGRRRGHGRGRGAARGHDATLEVRPVDERSGPEDVVEPTFGAAPDGGVASEYPADARTRDEVRAGMESVRGRVAACFEGSLPGGVLEVVAIIAPDGVVSEVSLPEALDEAQRSCVEGALIQARFRQVQGDPLRVVYPYAEAPVAATDRSP